MLTIFQAFGTSPAKNDLSRSEQKFGAISIAHFFNTRGGRWSGPEDLCGFSPPGSVLGILGGGMPSGFSNPDPTSDQKMSFFTPVFGPGL